MGEKNEFAMARNADRFNRSISTTLSMVVAIGTNLSRCDEVHVAGWADVFVCLAFKFDGGVGDAEPVGQLLADHAQRWRVGSILWCRIRITSTPSGASNVEHQVAANAVATVARANLAAVATSIGILGDALDRCPEVADVVLGLSSVPALLSEIPDR